jgi:hypothetical protein
MHIHRGILLVLVVMFVFSPTIQNWVSNNSGQWYRPFIVWADEITPLNDPILPITL